MRSRPLNDAGDHGIIFGVILEFGSGPAVKRWFRRFLKLGNNRAPVPKDQAVALLRRVFGDRLRQSSGSSHELVISVPELRDDPDFPFGNLCIPCKHGQTIKAPYLRLAVRAAELLGLLDDDEGGRR